MHPAPHYLTECPLCRSQAIQKVSAVITHGTGTGVYSGGGTVTGVGLGTGGLGVGVGSSSMGGVTSHSSTIARMLMPPPNGAAAVSRLQVCLVLGAGILGVAVFGKPYYPGIIAIAGMLGYAYWLREDVAKAEAKDRARMEVWHRLYYCPQCDNVLDPERQRHAPPEQIAVLW